MTAHSYELKAKESRVGVRRVSRFGERSGVGEVNFTHEGVDPLQTVGPVNRSNQIDPLLNKRYWRTPMRVANPELTGRDDAICTFSYAVKCGLKMSL